MAEEARSSGDRREPGDAARPIGRMEATVVRFDAVRLPSGLYTHRTSKVVIPVRVPEPA
jgi:hypothetical protein